MPRPKSPTLTDAELRLMDVLWEKGAATVGEVVAALPKHPPTAYSTALTILRILEDKGYLQHRKLGRAFVYEPVIGREHAQRTSVRHVMNRFFEGSPAKLVLNILETEELDENELRSLRQMLEQEGGAQ